METEIERLQRDKNQENTFPVIRLERHWLTALGFEEGQHVQVAQNGEKFVITLHEEAENQ